MRRAALVVLGMVLVGLAASMAAPVSAQDATPVASPAPMATVDTTPVDGTISFTVIDRAENDVEIDQLPEGASVGDLLIFANPVFDADNQLQVGTDQGWCILTDVAVSAWECTWSLYLPQGQIVVQGPYLEGSDSTFAIIGGTGEFVGARGEMALTLLSDGGYVYYYQIQV